MDIRFALSAAEGQQSWWAVSAKRPFEISIALDFQGPQPNAFGLSAARAEAVEAGNFVGDTRRGGSANCFDVWLNPHGNGTHTECVGHILDQNVHIASCLHDSWIPATLLSVPLRTLGECGEFYPAPHDSADLVISRAALCEVWEACCGEANDEAWSQGLVLRTLPNDESKRSRCYSGQNPPYLTTNAMRWCMEKGVRHLLVDVPSVDREQDDGQLLNHHLFWSVPPGQHNVEGEPSTQTITEMVYVDTQVEDGLYLLELQIPPFLLDAAPSRPRLWPARCLTDDE